MTNEKNQPVVKYGIYNFIYRMNHRKNFHYDSVSQCYVFRPKMWIPNLITVAVILAVFIYCVVRTKFGIGTSMADGNRLGTIFSGIFVPDFSYIFGYGDFSWESSAIFQALQTLSVAFIGTLMGSILALPFGFLASRKMVGKWAIITEIILICIRTIPEIILGYVMITGLGFSSLAGIMVFGIHSIGMIGKLYSEQLDEMDMQPLEALDACGASFGGKLKEGIIPMIAPNFLSVILYRFDLNLRTATMLGLVCGEDCGLGYWINTYSKNGHWPQFGAALWMTIIMIVAIGYFSAYIRKKLV